MTAGEYESVGDKVRVGRARKKLTLRQLASLTGNTASYLSDVENDRRVPSEAVLKSIASSLSLDFDELMAAAGRFGADADRYLRRNPEAGVLFRRLTEKNVRPDVIRRMLEEVPELQD